MKFRQPPRSDGHSLAPTARLMSDRPMPSAFDALLSTIIARATSEIAGAVRANMAEEIARAVRARVPGAPGARAVAAAPRVGRKLRVARVPALKAVPPRRRTKATAKGSKATTSDALAGRVLDLIAKTPGLRAEEISKQLGAKPDAVKAALVGLRESGKVKVSGKARGTSYRAA